MSILKASYLLKRSFDPYTIDAHLPTYCYYYLIRRYDKITKVNIILIHDILTNLECPYFVSEKIIFKTMCKTILKRSTSVLINIRNTYSISQFNS